MIHRIHPEFLAALAVQLAIDRGRPGIFGKGRQYRAGQLQTARIGRALQARNDTKALRIALVLLEIGALRRGQRMAFEQTGRPEPLADRT